MALVIHSLQNPRIKKALHLRDRRGRAQQARIIVDGWRETCRALESPLEPLELFVCESLLDARRREPLRTLATTRGVELTLVTPEVFRKLAFGERGEGVVLVAAVPRPALEQIRLSPEAVVCVLEGVEKPGNVGAIIRTADAAGISAVVVADGGTDLYNPNTIRASLGAIFRLPVAAAPGADVRNWLAAHNVHVYAARVDAAQLYTAVEYRRPCAIVLGSEASGLSDRWQGPDVQAVALPMCGVVDSLNVAATAAVLFYEAWRQKAP